MAQLFDILSLMPCSCCGEASDQLARYGDGELYCPECPQLQLIGTAAALRARAQFTGPSLPWPREPSHHLTA